ncbi:MAG: hypothetical protein R3E88_20335 [Myxococcota bacterium]|nr:hypothetical protein [Myxococcales bacterium]
MSRRPVSRRAPLRAVTASPGVSAALPADADFGLEADDGDVPLDELREFLSADLFEVPADPGFKNRLREKLWELVESRAFGFGPPPTRGDD